MRKWGIVISIFYALILLGLIVPGTIFIVGGEFAKWSGLIGAVKDSYTDWAFWILAAAILGGQMLLLFLSVDTSFQRLKPRAHILVSCVAASAPQLLFSAPPVVAVETGPKHCRVGAGLQPGIFPPIIL